MNVEQSRNKMKSKGGAISVGGRVPVKLHDRGAWQISFQGGVYWALLWAFYGRFWGRFPASKVHIFRTNENGKFKIALVG